VISPSIVRCSLTDFMNLKIKLIQSFGGAHRGRVCVQVFIGVSAHTCMSICICTKWHPVKKGVAEKSIEIYSLYSFFIIVIDFFVTFDHSFYSKKIKIIIYFIMIYFITT
jgi:hypothetical protein